MTALLPRSVTTSLTLPRRDWWLPGLLFALALWVGLAALVLSALVGLGAVV